MPLLLARRQNKPSRRKERKRGHYDGLLDRHRGEDLVSVCCGAEGSVRCFIS